MNKHLAPRVLVGVIIAAVVIVAGISYRVKSGLSPEVPTITSGSEINFADLLPKDAKDIQTLSADLNNDGISEMVAVYTLPVAGLPGFSDTLIGAITIGKKEGDGFVKIYENKDLSPHGDVAREITLSLSILDSEGGAGVFIKEGSYSGAGAPGCSSDLFILNGGSIVSVDPEAISNSVIAQYYGIEPTWVMGGDPCLYHLHNNTLRTYATGFEETEYRQFRLDYEFTGSTIEPILIVELEYPLQGEDQIKEVLYRK